MNHNAIEKINKIGKAGAIIAKLMKVCLCIGIFFTVAISIALFIIPEKTVALKHQSKAELTIDTTELPMKGIDINEIEKSFLNNDNSKMEFNDHIYTVTDSTTNDQSATFLMESNQQDFTTHNFAGFLISTSLYMVCALMIVIFAKKLCDNLKTCETPFKEDIIKNMNNLAICLIPTLILGDTFKSLGKYFLNNEATITIGIDLAHILMILIIFALVNIFKYGAKLQQESDETL